MFIGREKELKSLNNLYTSDKFEFYIAFARKLGGATGLNKIVKER